MQFLIELHESSGRIAVPLREPGSGSGGAPVRSREAASTSSATGAVTSAPSGVATAGAADVALDAVVKVMFSRPVDPGQVGVELVDEDGFEVPGAVSVAADGLTATFTPTGPLCAGTEYTATLTDAATSDGTSIDVPLIWSFTTVTTPKLEASVAEESIRRREASLVHSFERLGLSETSARAAVAGRAGAARLSESRSGVPKPTKPTKQQELIADLYEAFRANGKSALGAFAAARGRDVSPTAARQALEACGIEVSDEVRAVRG